MEVTLIGMGPGDPSALTGGALTGVISGDDVSAAMPTSGTVESADASVTAKPVNYGTITLIGDDAANYTLTQPNVTVHLQSHAGAWHGVLYRQHLPDDAERDCYADQ